MFDVEHTQCSGGDDNSENKGINIGNDNRKNRESIANQQNNRNRNNSFVESSSNTIRVRRYPALTSPFMAAKPFLACNRTTVAAFAETYPAMVHKHLHGGRASDGVAFAVGARNLLAVAKSVFDALGIRYWINSGTAKVCAFAHANLRMHARASMCIHKNVYILELNRPACGFAFVRCIISSCIFSSSSSSFLFLFSFFSPFSAIFT